MAEDRPGMFRMNTDIPEELHRDMQRCFPPGTKTKVVTALLRLACKAVDVGGPIMVGAILNDEDLALVYDPSPPNDNED